MARPATTTRPLASSDPFGRGLTQCGHGGGATCRHVRFRGALRGGSRANPVADFERYR